MEYMARWGPKGFILSPEKIVPLFDLATSVALKSDNGTDTSGAVATNSKGREPQTIEFATTYFKSLNVDPRAQYEEWESLVGTSHPLLIGGKRFGAEKMQLKSINLSDVQLTPTGEFLCATISIVLEECATVEKKASSSGGSSYVGGPGSSDESAAPLKSYLPPPPPNGKLTQKEYQYAMHTMPDEVRADAAETIAAIPGNGLNYNLGRGGGGINTLAGPKDNAVKQ